MRRHRVCIEVSPRYCLSRAYSEQQCSPKVKGCLEPERDYEYGKTPGNLHHSERGNTAWPQQRSKEGSPTYVSEPHPAISSVASVPSSRNDGDGLAGAVQELEIVRTVREGRPAERQQKDTDPLETAGTVVSPLPISDATGEQRIPDVLCSSTVTT